MAFRDTHRIITTVALPSLVAICEPFFPSPEMTARLLSVGQLCRQHAQTDTKLFREEHQLEVLCLLFIYFFPLCQFCHMFMIGFFFSFIFFFLSCLCLPASHISSSLATNMNILELRSLKGTMKQPPS